MFLSRVVVRIQDEIDEYRIDTDIWLSGELSVLLKNNGQQLSTFHRGVIELTPSTSNLQTDLTHMHVNQTAFDALQPPSAYNAESWT